MIYYIVTAQAAFLLINIEAATPTTPSPIISFSCEKNEVQGKVDIKLSKSQQSTIIQRVSLVSKTPPCAQKDNFTIENCTVGQGVEIDVLHEPKDSEVEKKNDVSRFILTCNENDNPSYTVQIESKQLTVNRPDMTPSNLPAKTVPALQELTSKDFTMTISPNKAVSIGKDLTIAITTSKTVDYMVQSCEAENANSKNNKKIPLWNNCQNKFDGFTGDWTNQPQSKSHHLQAFKFNDGNLVKISCTILICPKQHTDECTFNQVCPGTRKRRSVSSSETRTVSASFSVKDKDFQGSNSVRGTKDALNHWILFLMSMAMINHFAFARD